MIRPLGRRRVVALFSVAAIAVFAFAAPGDAQTWRWDYVQRLAGGSSIAGRSTVGVESGTLVLAFALPARGADAPIVETCRAPLADVLNASAVQSSGTAFLLVRLKPNRVAHCDDGPRTTVSLPANDARGVTAAALAINASTHADSPLPEASVAPRTSIAIAIAPVPRPSPSRAADAVHALVWTETSGAFAFVRLHNVSDRPLALDSGTIDDCGPRDAGCGALHAPIAIPPHGFVTLATVTGTSADHAPRFDVSLTLRSGAATRTLTSSDVQVRPTALHPMTDAEVRAAEAAALVALRSAPPLPPVPAFVGPKLVHRGSSRLAIGETGHAQVRLWIDPNGIPARAEIVTISNPKLAAAAIETAVSSTFAPAVDDGRPVGAKYIAEFNFDGSDPATAAIPLWKRGVAPPAPGTDAAAPVPAPAATIAPVERSAAAPVLAPPSPSASPSASPA